MSFRRHPLLCRKRTWILRKDVVGRTLIAISPSYAIEVPAVMSRETVALAAWTDLKDWEARTVGKVFQSRVRILNQLGANFMPLIGLSCTMRLR
jgi:hypothetical protein